MSIIEERNLEICNGEVKTEGNVETIEILEHVVSHSLDNFYRTIKILPLLNICLELMFTWHFETS